MLKFLNYLALSNIFKIESLQILYFKTINKCFVFQKLLISFHIYFQLFNPNQSFIFFSNHKQTKQLKEIIIYNLSKID